VLSSQHAQGNALDLRVPNVDNVSIANDFKTFLAGGVSIFPSLNFVHFDFGPTQYSKEYPIGRSSNGRQIAVQMSNHGGVFTVPALLNRTINLNFVLDSGATDVVIPDLLAQQLWKSRTISEADFIGNQTYELADGSTIRSPRFYLREIVVGNQVVRNVEATVQKTGSSLLLGQSFLLNFASWTVDNQRHALLLTSR
jgi:clan AA aspartic protease (TIGR02281 family)